MTPPERLASDGSSKFLQTLESSFIAIDEARKRSSTEERFLEVKGVGRTKCRQYGRVMIEKIRAYCLDHSLEMDR